MRPFSWGRWPVWRPWIAAAVLVCALLAATSPLGADYGNLGCHVNAPRCDEPAWPLEGLARGDLGRFVHDQPLMGPASLVLRAPFAAATRLFHANLTWHYRAGLFACLLVLAALALELARRSRRRLNGAVVALLVLVNPLVFSVIHSGHPEELVAAAAVVACGLLVLDGRSAAAAVVLGLALATKAWTLLVVAPLLLAVEPPGRRRFALIAIAVVAALYLPLAIADPHRFGEVIRAAGSLGSRYGEATAPDAWFFSAHHGDFVWPAAIENGQYVYADAPGYRISAADAHLAHALVIGAALLLTFAWWRGRRRETLFALLAAILLLRCLLDPGDHLYYHAAAVTALLAYEALRPRARFPWLALGLIAALWAVMQVATDSATAWAYLALAVPTCAWLALIACRRSRSIPPTARSPISRRPVTGWSRA